MWSRVDLQRGCKENERRGILSYVAKACLPLWICIGNENGELSLMLLFCVWSYPQKPLQTTALIQFSAFYLWKNMIMAPLGGQNLLLSLYLFTYFQPYWTLFCKRFELYKRTQNVFVLFGYWGGKGKWGSMWHYLHTNECLFALMGS